MIIGYLLFAVVFWPMLLFREHLRSPSMRYKSMSDGLILSFGYMTLNVVWICFAGYFLFTWMGAS